MKQFLLTLLFFTTSFISFAQYIEGTVLDAETKEPIAGVHVLMKGINTGTLTDEKGSYFLKISERGIKRDSIVFSHVTYTTLEIPYNSNSQKYSAYLFPDVNKLKEIKITEKRNLKQSIKYEQLASMEFGVYEFGAVLNDDKIYVVAGNASFKEDNFKKMQELNPEMGFEEFLHKGSQYSLEIFNNNLQIYDISKNTWETSELKFNRRANHNVVFSNNQLYVIGGKTLSKSGKREYLDDKIEVYDIETKTLKIDDTNPHQAVDFASFVYNENMMVMGGSISKNKLNVKQYNGNIHLYETNTGLWFHVGNMPQEKETQGVLVEDTFYTIGGFYNIPLNTIESYNLKTQKWKKEGELFDETSRPAITYFDNIIYIFEDGKISTFNVLTKELNQYFIELYLIESQVFCANDKLYILGGYKNISYSKYPSKELYSIDIKEFDKTQIFQSKNL
jgi:hypothetical protein